MSSSLFVVHVQIKVLPEHIEAFRTATITNATESRKEPGVVRFDVVQDREDPTRFVLVEVYRNEQATAAHKATLHYEAWRVAVEPLLAEPRTRRFFDTCDPAPEHWG